MSTQGSTENNNNNNNFYKERILNGQEKTNTNFKFLSSILDKIKGIWKARKEIAYMLSKMFLDASLAAVGLVFVFVPNIPVFMIGGGILALASVLYTVADAWELVKSVNNKSGGNIESGLIKSIEETESSPSKMTQGKGILEWLNFAAPLLLGFGLLSFGILASTPALLGMTGLSLVFKICSLVSGTAFALKALVSILLGDTCKRATSLIKRFIKNVPNVFIYGTGLALGISVLVLNGALSVIPLVFTLVFALRTVASVLDIFGENDSTKGVGRVARFLKSISFAVSAVSLGAAAIFFAPAVASFMGVTASFVQIAGGIGGGVCLFAAVMKFMFGFGSSSELKFSLCHKIFVEASLKMNPGSISGIPMNTLEGKGKKNELNERNEENSQELNQEPMREIKMEEEESTNQNDMNV